MTYRSRSDSEPPQFAIDPYASWTAQPNMASETKNPFADLFALAAGKPNVEPQLPEKKPTLTEIRQKQQEDLRPKPQNNLFTITTTFPNEPSSTFPNEPSSTFPNEPSTTLPKEPSKTELMKQQEMQIQQNQKTLQDMQNQMEMFMKMMQNNNSQQNTPQSVQQGTPDNQQNQQNFQPFFPEQTDFFANSENFFEQESNNKGFKIPVVGGAKPNRTNEQFDNFDFDSFLSTDSETVAFSDKADDKNQDFSEEKELFGFGLSETETSNENKSHKREIKEIKTTKKMEIISCELADSSYSVKRSTNVFYVNSVFVLRFNLKNVSLKNDVAELLSVLKITCQDGKVLSNEHYRSTPKCFMEPGKLFGFVNFVLKSEKYAPGKYFINYTITDNNSGNSVVAENNFTVIPYNGITCVRHRICYDENGDATIGNTIFLGQTAKCKFFYYGLSGTARVSAKVSVTCHDHSSGKPVPDSVTMYFSGATKVLNDSPENTLLTISAVLGFSRVGIFDVHVKAVDVFNNKETELVFPMRVLDYAY